MRQLRQERRHRPDRHHDRDGHHRHEPGGRRLGRERRRRLDDLRRRLDDLRGGSTTAGGGGSTAFGDAAAGKPLFTSKCGACHTLKDAGTSGQVGPDLDQSAKAKDPQAVYDQITKNAVPPMPLNVVTGDDAKNVAAYVASVSGK